MLDKILKNLKIFFVSIVMAWLCYLLEILLYDDISLYSYALNGGQPEIYLQK